MAQMRIETEISPAIKAYSMAVAPEASARSAIRAERIQPTFTANPGRILCLLESTTATMASEGGCPNARFGQQLLLLTILGIAPIASNVSLLPSCQRVSPAR